MKHLCTSLFLVFAFSIFCKVNGQTTPYVMSNDLDSIVFDVPLSTADSWKITAETTIFQHAASPNGAYNTWGSALFAQGSNPLADFYNTGEQSFQYYWAVNGGQFTLKNGSVQNVLRPNIAVDATEGVKFQFEIVSNGSGSLQLVTYVNDEKIDDRTSVVTTTSVACVSKASKYPVTVEVDKNVITTPTIFPVSDINFNDVPTGITATNTFTVNGDLLDGNITATVGGTDAAAFTVSPSSVAAGETFTVAFLPTEKKVYNATVTLSADGAEPVTFNLTGSSDFDLPVTISSEDNTNEHWYYLQFVRKAPANLVWAMNDSTRMVVQDTLKVTVNRLDQQWKLCGDWSTGYYIVNRANGAEVLYNTKLSVTDAEPRIYTDVTTADRYVIPDAGQTGNKFGFVHFNNGATWQLINNDVSKYNASTQRYVNDSSGKFVCAYLINDAGNEINFIPADKTVIFANSAPISITAPVGGSSTATLNVAGATDATDDISVSITGTKGGVFSVDNAVIPSSGGVVTITFTPQIDDPKLSGAVLTLKTTGADDVVINVSGTPTVSAPTASTTTSEYWYYLQFTRSVPKGLAWQGNGTTDSISQAIFQEANYAQEWKFIDSGEAGGYLIQNRNGGQLYFALNSSNVETGLAYLGDQGTPIAFYTGSATGMQFQILHYFDANANTGVLNDFSGAGKSVGIYNRNDAGGYITIIPAEKKVATIFPVADMNFDDVPTGATSTNTFTVNGDFLDGNIAATVGGTDATAFTVSPSSVAAGETFAVAFLPTEKKVYNATVTLSADGAEPVTFNLTGSSDFDLPVTISSEDNTNEHWYYLQFVRKAPANLVWAMNDSTRMVVQDTLKVTVNRLDQQWKLCGDWSTGYYIVNRANGAEVLYNTKLSVTDAEPRIYTDVTTADRYVIPDAGQTGNKFGFVHFNNGATWQLINNDVSKYNASTQRYVNDSSGKFVCAYLINDAGNEINFIPADKTVIFANSAPISITAPVGGSSTATLNVAGATDATDDISVSITGTKGGVFSVDNAVIPSSGGVVTITFTPQIDNPKLSGAVLTLKTAGADDVVINVSGTPTVSAPTASTTTKECWYYLQFTRSVPKGLAWQGNGTTDSISQAIIQEDNYAQEWKFIDSGEAGGYLIQNRNGGQLYFALNSSNVETGLAYLGDQGTPIAFYTGSATGMQFQILHYFDANANTGVLNDYNGAGKSVGIYNRNDAGNYITIIPAETISYDNILNPEVNTDSTDVLISTRYYTLQGIEVKKPANNGIYIVKNLFASGKTQVTKMLYLSK